jgi:glycosyltransferase involved in cell wall biosynthesis
MMMDLVIPFYNPLPGWEQKFVTRYNQLITDYFDGDKESIHVIVVNDGSENHFTEKEVTFLKENIPGIEAICYKENKGKGFALRTGVAKTKTDYCVYSDNDFPFGLGVVREMYDVLQQGADIVTSCRTSGNYFRHLPLKRRIASKGLAFVNKYLLRLPVSDTQAGTKAFNKIGKALFLQTTTDRFLFDMEFILLAGKVKDLNIRQIDVNITAGTKMTDFSKKIMKQEFKNLIRIILKKKNGKQFKKDII